MLHVIGAAVGSGGPDIQAATGPDIIKHSPYWKQLIQEGVLLKWSTTFREAPHADKVDILCELFERLAIEVKSFVEKKERFCVIGGDHSAAIGTWSGASFALRKPLGLIWIDAHKDAHTFETTPSGNIHGMPVAALLGKGSKRLTELMHIEPKILPQHLCLIGVRSFELAEHELLKHLNVKIYDMDAVKKQGISAILQEAREHVSCGTAGYGITLDLDGIDPKDAPAVSTPEPGGIDGESLLKAFSEISSDTRLVGLEIMEFNPTNDHHHKTEKFIFQILNIFSKGTK